MAVEQGIILCVPGPWADVDEMKETINELKAGFYFVGQTLFHVETETALPVVFESRDERMREAFALAGYGRMSKAEIDNINSHQSVAYVISEEIGLEGARMASEAAAALVRSGGLGVKCECSGIALAPHQWIENSKVSIPHDSYVLLVADEDCFYTCGMRVFGLADAAVGRDLDVQRAWDLVRMFNYFQIVDAPRLDTGHTFRIDDESPRYRLRHADYHWFPPDHYYHNPYGVWWLDPHGKE